VGAIPDRAAEPATAGWAWREKFEELVTPRLICGAGPASAPAAESFEEAIMGDRFNRFILLAILLMLGVIAARPYVVDRLYSATATRPIEPRGDLAEYERATVAIFDRVSPSVVQIAGQVDGAADFSQPGGQADDQSGDQGDSQGGGQGGEQGIQSGTGFIWDAAGDIVTNNHVVKGTSALMVRLASGTVSKAEIVGTTPDYDLAVIHIAGSGPLPPPIAVGSSADLQVGQAAFAIGNPFGLDQSLTTGIISALKRRLPTSGGHEIANVIQTDAPINPGNSGGPLLDSAGRLIGVNTAIYSPSGSNAGIGFAIPVDVVNRVVPELIRNGRVPTPGIGIVAGTEALTARLGVQGVVVVRTVAGSAAARSGLHGVDTATGKLGDVIVAADGKPVHRLPDLTDELEQVGVGKSVDLTLDRGGSKVSVSVQVADIGNDH
jgi:S1-C subfamily serine protease